MHRFSPFFALGLFFLLAIPAMAAPAPGSLIKLACPAGAPVDHVCKAVYFYGNDGKRHAFPNEKVYFTWYGDFSIVQTVSSLSLAAIPLGGNVTYRPGVRMVKFMTLDRVYAVALGGTLRWVTTEAAASALYGADWNQHIDDISDAFFANYRFGSDIASASDYNKTDELATANSIDADLPSTYRSINVATSRGTFNVDLVTLQRNRFDMITDAAESSDCNDGCEAKSLGDYAMLRSADVGIQGTYFCPPDYPSCSGQINTFLPPVFHSTARVMLNADALQIHEGPMIATATDGRYFFFHRTKDFGSSVSVFEASNNATLKGALANYPSLIENGVVIVESEARLAETNPTVKSVRGGIGYDDHYVYLTIARQATVTDLAYVMKTLGADFALNLDGAGSAALWYDGAYKVGPGRLLPNAILFRKK